MIRFAHGQVICYRPCIRDLECGHYCSEQCHAPCKCPCDRKGKQPIRNPRSGDPRGRAHTRGSPPKNASTSPIKHPAQHPQDLVDLTPQAQAFRDFATGGHIQADAAAIALANEAAAKERLRQLDEENTTMLFGESADTALVSKTNELTLTGTKQGRDGVIRNTYEGFYNVPEVEVSKLREPSLLD